MSSAPFEILRAVSLQLEDDFIDEDISEIQQGDGSNSRYIDNRTVTVRGKREGQALVLSYQDFYSTNFNPNAVTIYERSVLEIFAAQPKVAFEGRAAQRGWIDRMLRWFGGGGTRGPHPVFSRLRVDAEESFAPDCFEAPGFAGALEQLVLRPEVKRVLLQKDTGLAAVVRWHAGSSSPDYVLSLIDQLRGVTATLDR